MVEADAQTHPISVFARTCYGWIGIDEETDMARRPSDPRTAAEQAFKAATTKPVEGPPKAPPAVPGVKEQVTLRLDRDVLDFFQEGGPGWQDRINAALRKAAGK
jgi:uncharacterized protein (DUF4415 family)